MKILLTGSSGFIGRNIFEALNNEHDIYAPTHKELDLLNQNEVTNCLIKGAFDIVIHCANTNHVIHPEVINSVIEQDIRMYVNLAYNHDYYKRMIYFGSGAEYDINNYIPFMNEEYLGKSIPNDPYGFGKYVTARLTEGTENIYELCLFGVFGKYEEWKRRFISNVIFQCMNKECISINQHAMYDYLYIDDLISILRWFIYLDRKPLYHRYNICTSCSIDLYDLAEIIREYMNLDVAINVRNQEWRREYSGNNMRLLSEMGSYKFLPIRSAIKELIDFYSVNGFEQ